MATLGSPDKRAASAVAARRVRCLPGEDHGYAAGAAEIHALFAVRFAEARRRLPRHAIPFAIAALRDEKILALKALREKCAWLRLAADSAGRQDPERPAHRDNRRPRRQNFSRLSMSG